jgi:Holliday junction resolvase RusA-like endonuclease
LRPGEEIALELPWRPVPQERARSGKGRHYTPKATRNWQAQVAAEAGVVMRGIAPIGGPVEVWVTVLRRPPRSWSKRRQAEAIAGRILPTRKPDIDNLEKSSLDALKGVVWEDDSQVVDQHSRKRYGACERILIRVRVLEGIGARDLS